MAERADRAAAEQTSAPDVTAAAPPTNPADTADLASTVPFAFGWRWADVLVAWEERHPRVPLALALLAAVLARLVLVIRSNALIDGDEAMVGIQAERILRGDFPTYFYGQVYMGSLETYLIAALFRLFGPSPWALRAVPLLLSPLLVYLTWRLAHALLPRSSRLTPLMAGLAAFFAAVPPLYDAVAELRTWGGQIEIYIITLALLLATVELAERLRAGTAELARRWAIWGLLAGLGIWVNPLILYALLASVLWLALPYLRQAFPGLLARLRRDNDAAQPVQPVQRAAAATLLAVLPGMLVGGLPAWIYALRHAGANLLVYVNTTAVNPVPTDVARQGRIALAANITAHFAGCVAPQVLDGMMPTEPTTWLPLRLLLLAPPGAGILCALWLLRSRRDSSPETAGWHVRVGLPLLFAAAITAVFCLGTSAWPAAKNCAFDLAGRYAVPLVLIEPFLLLALFALPFAVSFAWHGLRRLRRSSGSLGARSIAWCWRIALLALLLGGFVQFGTYFATDAQAAFQSAYYHSIRQNQSQLYDYLRAHHIRAAWCNHWLGNIVTFRTDGQTVCADYYDQVVKGGIQRPPGTLRTVLQADRPSFILARVNPHPILARELDAQGIAYTIAVLPEAGVTIITPARTVNPATVVAGLAQDYGAN